MEPQPQDATEPHVSGAEPTEALLKSYNIQSSREETHISIFHTQGVCAGWWYGSVLQSPLAVSAPTIIKTEINEFHF